MVRPWVYDVHTVPVILTGSQEPTSRTMDLEEHDSLQNGRWSDAFPDIRAFVRLSTYACVLPWPEDWNFPRRAFWLESADEYSRKRSRVAVQVLRNIHCCVTLYSVGWNAEDWGILGCQSRIIIIIQNVQPRPFLYRDGLWSYPSMTLSHCSISALSRL